MQKVTQKYVNEVAYKIVGCAIEVHKHMGPGLLEEIYEKCLIEELITQGLSIKSQVSIPLEYKGKKLNKHHMLDLLVEDIVVVELKAVEHVIPVHKAQLLSYLKLTGKPKGLLINFHCGNITKSLIPLVTEEFALLPDS